MPQMVVKLTAAAKEKNLLTAEQITGEGVDLAWHWHNQKTRNLLKAKAWDYVVLQDRRKSPFFAAGCFRDHDNRILVEKSKGVISLESN
jgi:hypothetical protein